MKHRADTCWRGALLAVLLVASTACGGSVEQRLEDARQEQAAGRFEASIPDLRSILAEDPEHGEAGFRLGLALLRLGRHSEATFPLERASRSSDFGTKAGLVLASSLIQSRNFEEAIESMNRVLEREPGNQAAMLLLVQAQLQLNQPGPALETLERLEAVDPADERIRPLRADALALGGDLDEAEAIYRALLEERTGQESDGGLGACARLAEFMRERRKDADATAVVIEDCLERVPGPETVVAMAAIYDRIERQDEAIALLETGLAEHDDPTIRKTLAQSLIAEDRLEEAESLVVQEAERVHAPAAWMNVAKVRRQLGDTEGALAACEMAVEAAPGRNEQLLFARADLLVELGRHEEAQQIASELEADIYRDVIEGRIAQSDGEPARALELYSRSIEGWPNNYPLRMQAALAALDLGEHERAKAELVEVTRHAPKETDAALWLARIHLAEGSYQSSLAMANRHKRERGTTSADADLIRARALYGAGAYPAVQEVLRELAAEREGEFAVEALAESARLTRLREGAAPSLAVLDGGIAELDLDLGDPRNGDALALRLELLFALGRAEEAGAQVRGLLAERPESAGLHAMLGRVFLVQGDQEAAAAEFAGALELQAELPAALAGRALLEQRRGNIDAAIADMSRAAELAPLVADYAYMAGRMRLDRGDTDAGRRALEAVLRVEPDHLGAANDLAFELARAGEELDRALDLARRALRRASIPQVRDTVGYVHMKRGESLRARTAFESALSAAPDYGTARYHLALLLLEDGDEDGAAEALRVALQGSFPEEGEARDTLTRLEGTGTTVQ